MLALRGDDPAFEGMLGRVVVVDKGAAVSVGYQPQAGLEDGLGAAHIPVFESGDEVYVKVRLGLDHVDKLVP